MDVDHLTFDFDGVVRQFDLERLGRLATSRDLAPQAVLAAINEPTRLASLVSGEISRRDWAEEIGSELGSRSAAMEILGDRGVVRPAMRQLLERLAKSPVSLSLLTNGTDATEFELMQLGLLHLFDHVFNSAELGVAKPHPRIFSIVVQELHTSPDRVFFTDDRKVNVEAARRMGWKAEVFQSADELSAQLAALGVPLG